MKRNTNRNTSQIEPLGSPLVLMSESDSIEIIDELLINDLVKDALVHTLRSKIRFPKNTEFKRREADIYFMQEEYDSALQIYNTLDAEKNNPKRLISLAVMKVNAKKPLEAEALANLLKTNSSVDISSRAYAVLADIAFVSSDYKSMYRWSREAIKRNPFINSFADKFYLSVTLTNNYHKSIPFYETLLDDNPYSSRMWAHLSKCHEKLGFTIQAKDCMDMVSTIDMTV